MNILYVALPSDPTSATVWINLLGFEVGGSGFTVVDGSLDVGTMDLDDSWTHGEGPGGIQGRAEYPETEMRFNLMHIGASVDQMIADVQELGKALQRDGTIVFQEDGRSEPVFIDYVRSSIPARHRGQARSLLKLVNLLKDPDGLPIALKRHPFNRLSDVTVINAVDLTNATGDMNVHVDNPGNAPSELKLVIVNQGSDHLTQVQIGVKEEPADEFGDLYSLTPSASLAVAGANQWVRSWHEVISPTELSALSGQYRVFASMQMDGDLYAVQLRSAVSDVDVCGIESDVVWLDGRAYTAGMGEEADVDLGLVEFDDSGAALTLELWTRGDTDWLGLGNVVLMPATERLITLSSPGQRIGRYNKVTWEGTEYGGLSGSIDFTENESAILTENGDWWETPEDQLPLGIHDWNFIGHVREPTSDRQTIGTMDLYEDGMVIETTRLINKNGQIITGWDNQNRKRIVHVANGTSLYKLRVTFTASSTAGRKIRLHKVHRSYVPSVKNGESMVVDPLNRRLYIADTTGARMHPLVPDGPYPMIGPEGADLIFRFGVNGLKGIYSDADAREPLVKTGTAHGATVTGVLTPRSTH